MTFKCLECGYCFRSVRAAELAAFGDNGCPGCGGSDVDLGPGPLLTAVVDAQGSSVLRAADEREAAGLNGGGS